MGGKTESTLFTVSQRYIHPNEYRLRSDLEHNMMLIIYNQELDELTACLNAAELELDRQRELLRESEMKFVKKQMKIGIGSATK